MGSRGRDSAASLGVVRVISGNRPEPLEHLSAPAALLWLDIVNSLHPDYFRPSDLPILAAYCQAAEKCEKVAERLKSEELVLEAPGGRRYANPLLALEDSAARRLASLAVKLRLCPSTRYSAKKAAGPSKGATSGHKPWADPES